MGRDSLKQQISDNKELRDNINKTFDNVRYVGATVLTLCCIGLVIYAIGKGYAALPGHPILLYLIFLFVVILLGYLEGLQIAILALERTSPSTFKERKRAYVSHSLAMRNRGRNVQRFLVGRQFFVVFVVFICAQLTTYSKIREELYWMPDFIFTAIIQTGLPGALIVLSFGQLMPQLIATTNPVDFMNFRGTWSVIQLCLTFEAIGVTHFSWVLSWVVRTVFRMGEKETILEDAKEKNLELGLAPSKPVERKQKELSLSGDMNIKILDADVLFSGADEGLTSAKQKDVNSMQTMRWLKDDSMFGQKKLMHNMPMPPTIVRHLVQNGQPVPRYLLPPYHKDHIPPHIVCYELLRRQELRKIAEHKEITIHGCTDSQDHATHIS